MASSMRSVRRRLRRELLQVVTEGKGDLHSLRALTREMMGRIVPIDVLMETFAANEVSNALAQMRIVGDVESVGRTWKLVAALSDADVETISIRRLKRLRGELKAQQQLAHDHGRIEEAFAIGRLLEIVGQELCKREAPVDQTAEAS